MNSEYHACIDISSSYLAAPAVASHPAPTRQMFPFATKMNRNCVQLTGRDQSARMEARWIERQRCFRRLIRQSVNVFTVYLSYSLRSRFITLTLCSVLLV